ncbi:MAG: hypothetical protein JWO87_2864 [Phycisphaerales bacterium]|nr:hypothetical protein [Phycisphaerales bacterium]
MDKLERYLDQVCRGIAGPRSLRQHVRRELREHLLDAAAERQAGGLPPDEALDRAIEDFGGPEQVRAELEATHGHRLMAVVIDKAMQWKENTMKAKWLWSSWAHLALAGILAIECVFLAGTFVFIAPKFKQMWQEGWINMEGYGPLMSSALTLFGWADWIREYCWWLFISTAVIWALFEWRSRGEQKPFIRLAAMGSAALLLMAGIIWTFAAITLPMIVSMPNLAMLRPDQVVAHKTATIDKSVAATEQAMANKDWPTIEDNLRDASHAADTLAKMGSAAPMILSLHDQPKVEALRTQLTAASLALRSAELASRAKNSARMESAMKEFHEAYGKAAIPTTQPATMPAK